jgi:hypothetical protein
MLRVGLHAAKFGLADANFDYIPPLSLRYLAAYAERQVEGVEFFAERNLDRLIEQKPDLVGITSLTPLEAAPPFPFSPPQVKTPREPRLLRRKFLTGKHRLPRRPTCRRAPVCDPGTGVLNLSVGMEARRYTPPPCFPLSAGTSSEPRRERVRRHHSSPRCAR